MKIACVGAGYVGFSLSILLSKYNPVKLYDIDQEKIKLINKNKCPFKDNEINRYLKNNKVNVKAFKNIDEAIIDAKYIIIATPTDYDSKNNMFDTSSVEATIKLILKFNKKANIVIKSTIPVGFTDKVKKQYNYKKIFFSPEFLREGISLTDNQSPSRIILGTKSKEGKAFAKILLQLTINKKNIPVIYMESKEAEAVKLFSNSFLAMRIAFFNELDSFAIGNNIKSKEIIKGVSLDNRIGDYYNNPSFGYGGYCLPKDTKQLLSNYNKVPNNIIRAIVDANRTRKDFISDHIISLSPKKVGVYRLTMKTKSTNFKSSAIQGIMKRIKSKGIEVVVYEPIIKSKSFFNSKVENNLKKFKRECDIIITNRFHKDLQSVKRKVFTRDLFRTN